VKRIWQLQEAKARFSEVVELAMKGEAQTVTRRGCPAVVVLDWETYTRLLGQNLSLFEALRPAEPLSDEEADALLARPQADYREVGL
jgi:prevent-host-death family protein